MRRQVLAIVSVLSDLHIEFGELRLAKRAADVLLLPGDIHLWVNAILWADRTAQHLDLPVVIIAGNHEHYKNAGRHGQNHRDRHVESCIDALRERAAQTAGRVTFLERETAVVAGVRFIGATLWTDFNLFGDPALAKKAALAGKLTDYNGTIDYRHSVKFTPDHAISEHETARRFIAEACATPFAGSTVIMTHHAPSARSVPEKFASELSSAAYASNLDALVEASGAALWVHGHIHDSKRYRIGRTEVLSNPRGYANEEPADLNSDFDPNLTVDLAGVV
jgi:hypothetical protein